MGRSFVGRSSNVSRDDSSRGRPGSWADDAKVLTFGNPASAISEVDRARVPDLGHDDALRLMERLRDGDVEAFERIVGAFWSEVLLYARHLVRAYDPADDLAQEAFARLWQGRNEWRGGSVRVWLLRTVRRLFLSRRRKERVREEWTLRQQARSPAGISTPSREVERTELRAAIAEAVGSLPPRRREAFTLVHLQGLSNVEVSEIMDVRPQTVANYLQAAFADLRETLRPHVPSFDQAASRRDGP